MSAPVDLRHVSKSFLGPGGIDTTVLTDVSLAVPSGGVTCIIGASGCGKSTLLRIIGGLERDYSGEASVGGRPIVGAGLDRGLVFQDHRLVPWMTVADNVAFALHRLSPTERRARVEAQLDLVGLTTSADAYPDQLSGGMAQRVALARALSHDPQVLLLDEPFGALDALTRLRMQDEVLRLRAARNVTMIVVTHDIEEAIYLGDQVVVLSDRPGRVVARMEVELPRPRDRADPVFVALRREIHHRFFTHH
ncbi:ABC transporter ATP-binding protein [Siculibacillus lacustris]|uniref:ABC transporter ATP-binding protein n=1 Tax=Siculibacillus lacustris TaxID=1549641 RepID=A0A4Q9VLA1_9HYPH|nr:ABC transporter ATP-binding protein [Siculibacillus lacustris]TBW36260.1 ABC transporter ATP-binding protein [Siculibacillus lacustris]